MFEGIILMVCAISMPLADHFRKRDGSKWEYFGGGILFAFGSQWFIPALVRWLHG